MRRIDVSEAVKAARKPLPPHMLVDALQDRVHYDMQGGRPGRSVKYRAVKADREPSKSGGATLGSIIDRIESVAAKHSFVGLRVDENMAVGLELPPSRHTHGRDNEDVSDDADVLYGTSTVGIVYSDRMIQDVRSAIAQLVGGYGGWPTSSVFVVVGDFGALGDDPNEVLIKDGRVVDALGSIDALGDMLEAEHEKSVESWPAEDEPVRVGHDGPKLIADIVEHLGTPGGVVQITTHMRSTIYDSRHKDWFRVSASGRPQVRTGNKWVDIGYTEVRFGARKGRTVKVDDEPSQLYALRNIRIKDRIDPVAQPAVPHRLAHAGDLSADEVALLNGSEAAEEIAEALSTIEEAIQIEETDGDEGLAAVLDEKLDDFKDALVAYSTAPEESDEEEEALEDGKRTASAMMLELERRDPFAKKAGLGSTLRKLRTCMEALGKAIGPVSEAEAKKRKRKRRAAKAKKEAEIQKAPVDDAMAERRQYEADRGMDAMTPAQRQATVTMSDWSKQLAQLVTDIGKAGASAGLISALHVSTNAMSPEDKAFMQRQMKELGAIAPLDPKDMSGPSRAQAAMTNAASGLRRLGGQMSNKDVGGLMVRVAEELESYAKEINKYVLAAKELGGEKPAAAQPAPQSKDWAKSGAALAKALKKVIDGVTIKQYDEWSSIVSQRAAPLYQQAAQIRSKEDIKALFDRIGIFAEAIEEMWTDNWPPNGLTNEIAQKYIRYNKLSGGKPNGAWDAEMLKKPMAALRAKVEQGTIPSAGVLAGALGFGRNVPPKSATEVDTGPLRCEACDMGYRSGPSGPFGGDPCPDCGKPLTGGRPRPATKALNTDALEMLRGDVLRYVADAKGRRGTKAARLLEAYGKLLGSISREITESGEVTKPQRSAIYGHAQVVEDALAELGMDRQADRLVELRDMVTESFRAPQKAVAKAYRSGKRWVARSTACDACKKLAKGPAVKEDSDFPGGIPGPPLHPHCRCGLKKGFFPMKSA